MNTIDFQASLVKNFAKAAFGSLFAANCHPIKQAASTNTAQIELYNSHQHVLHDGSASESRLWNHVFRD